MERKHASIEGPGTSLMVLWLRLGTSNAGDMGLMHGIAKKVKKITKDSNDISVKLIMK